MTRSLLLVLLLAIPPVIATATKHTVTAVGTAFSPPTLNITEGDTVVFTISGIHDALEVSQATWNADGTIVFVEVRRRTSASHGSGMESVTPAKRRRVITGCLLVELCRRTSNATANAKCSGPAGGPAVPQLTAKMLDRGTKTRDKRALAKFLDDVGAELERPLEDLGGEGVIDHEEVPVGLGEVSQGGQVGERHHRVGRGLDPHHLRLRRR